MADEATHKAIEIGGIPFNIYENENSLDNPLRVANFEEEFQLIEAHIGDSFDFARVIDSGGSTVVVRMVGLVLIDPANIDQFQVGMPTATDQFIIPELQIDSSNLENIDLNIPFIEAGKYYIVIDTRTMLLETFNVMIDEYKKKAIKLLIEYYGKLLPLDEVEAYALDSVNNIQKGAPYFPLRPGQNIRVKISIPRATFDSLPDMTFEKLEVQNLHVRWIAISLNASTFKSDIDQLALIMQKYNRNVLKFSGTVLNLNFSDLAIKLKRFFSEFNKMLIANDLSLSNLSPDAKFELGFNRDTFNLGYVLLYDPYGKFLKTRTNILSSNMDIKIAKLLISHRDVFNASMAGMSWMDFLSNFFPGDYEIRFNNIGSMANSSRKGMSDLKADFDLKMNRFDELAFKSPFDELEFNKLRKDPSFKLNASKLLLSARDKIGDNFLLDLPNIIANIDDLESLFSMIFDKTSIKDLVDVMMSAVSAELSLPDFNEIKIRGIFKKLNFDMSLEILFDVLDEASFQLLMIKICEAYSVKADTIDKLLEDLVPGTAALPYMLNFDISGNLQGLVADFYDGGDDQLQAKLAEIEINNCVELALKVAHRAITTKDFFQETSAASILCELLTNGLPEIQNICYPLAPGNLLKLPTMNISDIEDGIGLNSAPWSTTRFDIPNLKMNILRALKKMDKGMVKEGIQSAIKDLFELDPNIYLKFMQAPKIRMEIDKLSLTKDGLLSEFPGLGISTELKKLDVSFELPKIKDINPSFDFAKFLLPTFDIFQLAIKAIETGIIKGIEAALLGVFKGILKGVLKALKSSASDLRAPDFGGISMPDLLDATDGFSMDNFADLALPMINKPASTSSGSPLIMPSKGSGMPNSMTPPDFDFTSFPDLPTSSPLPLDFEYSGFSEAGDGSPGEATAADLRQALEDMSQALKPLELLQIAKGQFDREDFKNMTDAVKDPKIKALITEDVFNDIMRTAADYADMDMLEDIEKMYDDKEIITSLCDNLGIDYGDAPGGLGSLREALINKFPDLPVSSSDAPEDISGAKAENTIDKIIADAVEEAKDSLVDAIGSMKDDFNESLPFDEDPCSFMPKPSQIPALNFANNLVFDSTFDAVKKEYKKEATTFPDMMLQTRNSDTFIPLYYLQGDKIPIKYDVDAATGVFSIVYTAVNADKVLNREFGDHYHGENTDLYAYNMRSQKFVRSVALHDHLSKNRFGEYEWDEGNWLLSWIENTKIMIDVIKEPFLANIYVKNTSPELAPIPELKDFLSKIQFSYTIQYTISEGSPLHIDGDQLYIIDLPDDNLKLVFDQNGKIFTDFPSSQVTEGGVECVDIETHAYTPDEANNAILEFETRAMALVLKDYHNNVYNQLKFNDIIKMNDDPDQLDKTIYKSNRDVLWRASWDDSESTTAFDSDLFEGTSVQFVNILIADVNPEDGLDSAVDLNMLGDYHAGNTKKIYHRMTKILFDKLAYQFSKSEYFDINTMQTFIFDSDDIDLLKADEAKNSAKDEFNEECTFREEDKSKIKTTSIKKLLALTMRLYMIEMIVRGCFIFGHVLPKEEVMNEALFKYFFKSMIQELKEISTTYFSVFRENFEKEYKFSLFASNDEINPNPKLRQICSEIYSDLMSESKKIFPNAKDNFYDLLFDDESEHGGLELYRKTTIDLPVHAHSVLRDLKLNIQYNQNIERIPFSIQRLYVIERGDGTRMRSFLYDDFEGYQWRYYGETDKNQYSYDSPPKLIYRLCYFDYADKDMRIAQEAYAAGSLTRFYTYGYFYAGSAGEYQVEDESEFHTDKIYKNPESWNRKFQQGEWTELFNINIDKDLESHPIGERDWSLHDYNHRYGKVKMKHRLTSYSKGGLVQSGYMVAHNAAVVYVPVAEIYDTDTGISLSEVKKYFWDEFFVKNMNLDKYYVLFLMGIISKTATAKPDIRFAFAESKMVLKRAIEALSLGEETFDHQDKDNENIDDMSEISTEPDSSNIAKKLALATVNMMVKGNAEKFDPNIRESKKIRKLAREYGINLTPGLASQLARPWNYMPRRKDLEETFLPGMPILKLGRRYLKSGYLDPKERKEIADIKSGKQTNALLIDGYQGMTATLREGASLQYPDKLVNWAEINAAREKYDGVMEIVVDLYETYVKYIQKLQDKNWARDSSGDIWLPNIPYGFEDGSGWFPLTYDGEDNPGPIQFNAEYHHGFVDNVDPLAHGLLGFMPDLRGNQTSTENIQRNMEGWYDGFIRLESPLWKGLSQWRTDGGGGYYNAPIGLNALIDHANDYFGNLNHDAGWNGTVLDFKALGYPDPADRHNWTLYHYIKTLSWMMNVFWFDTSAQAFYGGGTSLASTLRLVYHWMWHVASNYDLNDPITAETLHEFIEGDRPMSRAMVTDLWAFYKTFLRIAAAAQAKISEFLGQSYSSMEELASADQVQYGYSPALTTPKIMAWKESGYDTLLEYADFIFEQESTRVGLSQLKEVINGWEDQDYIDDNAAKFTTQVIHSTFTKAWWDGKGISHLLTEAKAIDVATAQLDDMFGLTGALDWHAEYHSLTPFPPIFSLPDIFKDVLERYASAEEQAADAEYTNDYIPTSTTTTEEAFDASGSKLEFDAAAAVSMDSGNEADPDEPPPDTPAGWQPSANKTDRQNMKALGLVAIAHNGGDISSSGRAHAENQVRAHPHFEGIKNMPMPFSQFNIKIKNGILEWWYPKNDVNGNYPRD